MLVRRTLCIGDGGAKMLLQGREDRVARGALLNTKPGSQHSLAQRFCFGCDDGWTVSGDIYQLEIHLFDGQRRAAILVFPENYSGKPD